MYNLAVITENINQNLIMGTYVVTDNRHRRGKIKVYRLTDQTQIKNTRTLGLPESDYSQDISWLHAHVIPEIFGYQEALQKVSAYLDINTDQSVYVQAEKILEAINQNSGGVHLDVREKKSDYSSFFGYYVNNFLVFIDKDFEESVIETLVKKLKWNAKQESVLWDLVTQETRKDIQVGRLVDVMPDIFEQVPYLRYGYQNKNTIIIRKIDAAY